MIELLRAGPLTTVQDLGRPGWAHLGVPRSGALDQPALVAANLLVGNPPGAAGLEITLTGCRLRALTGVTLAVTGAEAEVTVDRVAAGTGVAVAVPAGGVVRIGAARSGVRSYLSLAGGVAAEPVLGSRSTDTLSGLGPAPLRDGDTVVVADPPWPDRSGVADLPGPVRSAAGTGPVALRLWPGPRRDWFTADAQRLLRSEEYTVGMLSNRVGSRLAGPALARAVPGELPSEGIVCGAVQVPADGQPLIFLADHPTTGGYPVVGVVDPADLPVVAQLRPGAAVRFTAVGPWS